MRRILHVEAFCAVGAALPLPRGSPVHVHSLDRSSVTLFSKETILASAERHREAERPRGCLTQGQILRTMLVSLRCSLSGTVTETRALRSLVLFVLGPPGFANRYARVKGDNATERGASRRGRVASRWSDTGTNSAHNASLAPLLTLTHCQGYSPSLLSSFCSRSPSFCQSRGTLPMSQENRRRRPLPGTHEFDSRFLNPKVQVMISFG